MYQNGGFKKSIKRKVVIRVTSFIAVILTIAIGFIIYLTISNLQDKASYDLKNIAKIFVYNISQRLEYLRENTELFGKNDLLINAFIDEEERDKYLPPLVNNFKTGKYLNSLSVVDFYGRVIFKTDENVPKLRESNELRLALSLAQTVTYFNTEKNEVIFIIPINYYSTTQGAIVATYDMKNIIDKYSEYEDFIYTRFFKNSIEFYNKNYEADKKYHKYLVSDDESNKMLQTLGMKLEIGIPNEVYLKPLQKQILILTLFALFILAIGGAISYYLATTITDPILKLYNSINKIEDKKSEYEPLGSDDELEILGFAFYKKQKELDDLNKSLDIKVKEAVKELEKNELLKKNILSTIPDMIWLKDINGFYITCNPEFENFIGAKECDIKGKTDYDLLANDLADFFKKYDEKALESDELLLNEEWVTYANNGHRALIETTRKQLKKADGTIFGILGIGHDITERNTLKQALEEERNRFSLAIDGAQDGLWDWEIDKDKVYFSKRWKEMIGFSDNEFTDEYKNFFSRIHPDDGDMVQTALDNHFKDPQNNQYAVELRLLCKDETYKWILTRGKASLNKDGTPHRMVGSHTDISSQKSLEENLLAAKERAEEASKVKSEFLANMSHEIRTPLNGIIGLTSLALKTDMTVIQRDYLYKSVNASNALLGIINDILDYSKIEANKMKIEETDFELDVLLHQILDLFHFKAQENGVELVSNISHSIFHHLVGDPLRLKQVLTNLVGNAIKFTHHGQVSINVELLDYNDETINLKFSVKDSGIGISDEQQKMLFQAFNQADTSNTRKYGGTGLGLAISKQLIELMGGEISVGSKEGVGSEFSFRVALKYLKFDSTQIIKNLKDKNILIVDDQKDAREMLDSIFKSFDSNTTLCNDALSALEVFNSKKFDYIFVDWKMPDIDGIEFIKMLKEKSEEPLPEIIMITAYGSKNELLHIAKTSNVDISKIVLKPFTSSSLLDVMVQESDNIKIIQSNEKYFKASGKVLLVEDNEINQIVAQENLESYGLKVAVAENGLIAVQKVKDEKYDIIFMDLQMPVMDGFEAASKIRKFDENIPIVALSAAVMQQDILLTKKAGMNDHISKPINLDELKSILVKYLDNSVIETNHSSGTAHGELENIEGVDLEELTKRLNNRRDITYKLLTNFLDNNMLKQLDSLEVGAKDFNDYIHNLKGVSGNLSLTQVYKECVEIYTSDSLEHRRAHLVKLKESAKAAVSSISRALNDKVQESKQAKHFDVTKEEVLKSIDSIIDAIDVGTLVSRDAAELLIEKINSLVKTDLTKELQINFSKYEYEKAKTGLNKIKGELA